MWPSTILEANSNRKKKGYPSGSLFFARRLRFRLGAVLATLFLGAVALGCSPSTPEDDGSISLAGEAQGTTFSVLYWPESGTPEAEVLADSVQRYLADFNRVASAWDSSSVLSRWNRGDAAVRADSPDAFRALLDEGKRLKAYTDGWMDPAVGKYTTAWGFNGAKALLGQGSPNADSAMIDVLRKSTDVVYDVNAYAQGSSVDGVARLLKRNGVKHALVEIGGELVALGGKPDVRPFAVSVDFPAEERQEQPLEVVELKDRGMATSGDYRSAKKDPVTGRRYGHTLNPFTGWTGQTDVLSATVFARTAAEADGVATALVAMGADKAKKWLQAHPECDALLVLSGTNGSWTVYRTPGVIPKRDH
jgi:thiamine biosynthesis lipoprotein